jgi:hypothetical protein
MITRRDFAKTVLGRGILAAGGALAAGKMFKGCGTKKDAKTWPAHSPLDWKFSIYPGRAVGIGARPGLHWVQVGVTLSGEPVWVYSPPGRN